MAERPIHDAFVDTGVFYALQNERDSQHDNAIRLLQAAGRQRLRLLTSNFVVAETHALLLNRRSREQALAFVRSLLVSAVAVERITEDDEREAVRILEAYSDKDFSYTDASSFALMRRHNVELALAFDRHFSQFGLRTLAP